jgi:hypothetical protein
LIIYLAKLKAKYLFVITDRYSMGGDGEKRGSYTLGNRVTLEKRVAGIHLWWQVHPADFMRTYPDAMLERDTLQEMLPR